MRNSSLVVGAALLGAAFVATPRSAAAQQRGNPPRGQTIVIHGQVPTPQVVTVRPRQVPDYGRQPLGTGTPAHSFWSTMLPAYRLVPERQITGHAPRDAVLAAGAVPAPASAPASAVPAPAAPEAMSAAARAAAIDSMRADLVRRRARLDSLERAMRGLGAEAQTTQNLGTPPARQAQRGRPVENAQDASARATEIQALLKELEYRRARLDSLEAVVKSLGHPRAPTDSSRSPRDRSRTHR
jgi:hypothetical protein